MASTNKTSLGLNMWEASDKPVRQDFINDNKIIDERIAKLNSDIATRYTNAFTEYPSDVLGTNGTLKILTVDIPNGTTDSYSPPVNRTGNRWFNVLTFGRANRCTQIACYSFLTHNSDNKVWIRTQHDNSVSAWKEL